MLPGWLSGKELAYQCRRWIPGLGRSPGGGDGNPLQYSCLEKPVDRGAWGPQSMGLERVRRNWATEHGCSLDNKPSWQPEARKSILVSLLVPRGLSKGGEWSRSTGRCLSHTSLWGGVGTRGHSSRFPSYYLSTYHSSLQVRGSEFTAPSPKPPVNSLIPESWAFLVGKQNFGSIYYLSTCHPSTSLTWIIVKYI